MAEKNIPEENIKFVDKIRGVFRKLVGADQAAKTTEFTATGDSTQYMSAMQALQRWYQEAFSGTGSRIQKYDRYRFLDENLAEASASLNVYADNIVSGAVGGEENYKVVVDAETKEIEKIEKIITEAEKRTGIKDDIWEIARELTSFGDVFTEVVVVQKDNEICIDRLKPLPEKEMFLDVDERGIVKDLEKPYFQRLDPASAGIKFDEWRVIHFKVGRRVYGVDRSLFANASQRVGRQLLWIDEALVLARLSRAWMRYAFQIDTQGLSPEQKWDFVDKFMDRVRRRELIDRTTGKIGLTDNMMLPDEDIGIPVSGDSRNAVTTLTGDTNLGNIFDVKYLQSKLLMALTMPKAYVSLEEGIGTRATLAQIDIQFARQVRRRQQAMIPGLRKFYRLVFVLAGVDPDSFTWDIVFPELATADEMIRWQVEQAKALVARTYLTEMGVVNIDYVLHEILGFDDDKIKKYGAVAKEPLAGGGVPGMPQGMNLPPETAQAIRRDPILREMLDNVRDMVAWKVAREQKMKDKVELGIRREESLRDKPNAAL
jgi:hypothetical protein